MDSHSTVTLAEGCWGLYGLCGGGYSAETGEGRKTSERQKKERLKDKFKEQENILQITYLG